MNKKGKIALLTTLFLAIVLLVSYGMARPGVQTVRECRDGIDNDNDGYVDWPNDPGCTSKNDLSEYNPLVECDDGLDNDQDNAVDMADGGCASPTDDDESNCGDGICEGLETQQNCPADCGIPDSCDDTDYGFDILTQGTTYGYFNNENYSSTDYCQDSLNIVEYYCGGDGWDYEQSQVIDCSINATGCANGVCFY